MNRETVENTSLFLSWRPNRSLTPRGRRGWLALIALATSLSAGVAAFLGAWPVLPFAGAEILLVWLAFRHVALHDNDYEKLEITRHGFHWVKNDRGRLCALEGNSAWLQVESRQAHGRHEVYLRYAGSMVAIARMATDDERRRVGRQLAATLAGMRL